MPKKKAARPRVKGPVDYDKQCGVINDKGLPCSRSLTCKSHSMGAKRAVQGRSKPYDELLLEWNRLNNPNWVEPVKRPTKQERKEQKEQDQGVLALKAREDRERYHKVTRGRSIVGPAPVVTELVVVERRIEPDPAASHERRDEQK